MEQMTDSILKLMIRNGMVSSIQLVEFNGIWLVQALLTNNKVCGVLRTARGDAKRYKNLETAVRMIKSMRYEGQIVLQLDYPPETKETPDVYSNPSEPRTYQHNNQNNLIYKHRWGL